MEPIDRSTVWRYDESGEPGEFVYSRHAHPTGVAAERALGELEGGNALLFASGTAAVTACVHALCRSGSAVAFAEGAYFGTLGTLREFDRWGLRVVEFDQAGTPPAGADVVWVESPANPLLTTPNWEAVRAHPAVVVCDATASTPVYLRALDEGADIVVHSATKYLTGHHDALLGAAVTRDEATAKALYETRLRLGLTPSPEAAFALLRGLKTLDLRMRRHTESATEIARRLDSHGSVLRVRYPGIGGLISFDVDDDAARVVETRLKLIANQTSLGGVVSSLESRHRWEGDRVPRGLLRLSVGVEDVEAIWADLAQALESA